jgi:CubicO group peptidase (beta-lactamase class C family)
MKRTSPIQSTPSRKRVVALLLTLVVSVSSPAQELYFPPAQSTGVWETRSPQDLNWCQDRLDSLQEFLRRTYTKAFIILKDGRIVREWYFDAFQRDSVWYWASAGKTATAALVGIAQDQKLLDINAPSSRYLGNGWSMMTKAQEDAITVRHHLTMTTGVEGRGPDDTDCRTPDCFTYRASPGTIWDYYNPAYLKLQDIVAAASKMNFTSYYTQNLARRIGMGGVFINGVLWSVPRSMARFGLLLLAKGMWNGDTVIRDQSYFTDMVSTSQNLNPSYGYLFWLNGKDRMMLPGIEASLPGPLIPQAPSDLYMGLGMNDQKLYVIPSQNMVIIRMGNPPTGSEPMQIVYDRQIWELISALPCATSVTETNDVDMPLTWPNPVVDVLHHRGTSVVVRTIDGRVVRSETAPSVDISNLPSGVYMVESSTATTTSRSLVVKQ